MFKYILVAVIGVFVMTGCNSSQGAPTDITGTWHQASGSPIKADFSAVISEDSIKMDVKMPESRTGYWYGSFTPTMENGDTFESEKDEAAMESMPMRSNADTKVFTFKDGQLSFDFSIMGITTTIYLEK